MLKSTQCCGVKEWDGLEDGSKETLKEMARGYFGEAGPRFAHITFTDATCERMGRALARKIKREKLGMLVESPKKHNPNSGNNVVVWVFTPNNNLKKYAKH